MIVRPDISFLLWLCIRMKRIEGGLTLRKCLSPPCSTGASNSRITIQSLLPCTCLLLPLDGSSTILTCPPAVVCKYGAGPVWASRGLGLGVERFRSVEAMASALGREVLTPAELGMGSGRGWMVGSDINFG
jgi:hypothetical protein